MVLDIVDAGPDNLACWESTLNSGPFMDIVSFLSIVHVRLIIRMGESDKIEELFVAITWIHWIETRLVIPVANNWSSKGSRGVKFQQINNFLCDTFAWLSNCALFKCMISYFCSDYSFFFFIVFHCVTNVCVSYISKFWHLNSDLCLVILMMPNEFHAECQFTVLIWPIHLLWGYGKEGKMWTEDIIWYIGDFLNFI